MSIFVLAMATAAVCYIVPDTRDKVVKLMNAEEQDFVKKNTLITGYWLAGMTVAMVRTGLGRAPGVGRPKPARAAHPPPCRSAPGPAAAQVISILFARWHRQFLAVRDADESPLLDARERAARHRVEMGPGDSRTPKVGGVGWDRGGVRVLKGWGWVEIAVAA